MCCCQRKKQSRFQSNGTQTLTLFSENLQKRMFKLTAAVCQSKWQTIWKTQLKYNSINSLVWWCFELLPLFVSEESVLHFFKSCFKFCMYHFLIFLFVSSGRHKYLPHLKAGWLKSKLSGNSNYVSTTPQTLWLERRVEAKQAFSALQQLWDVTSHHDFLLKLLT